MVIDTQRVTKNTVEFLRDLLLALKGIPSSMRQAWKDSHTVTPWLREWRKTNLAFTEDGRPMFVDCDHTGLNSYHDYRAWLWLGRISDALLILIAVLILLCVVLAVL